MAYYFMVESKKGEHLPLNISSSKYFPRTTTKYKKPNAYTLQEIDQFTMMFDNEVELRNALIEEGILPPTLGLKPLSTRFLSKNKYHKVMYDLLYQKDIEYIAFPTKVVELIMKRYYQNDLVFIQKLANNFSNYYECSTTAPEVARLIETSIRTGARHRALDEPDLNGDRMVSRLVKLLILKHYEWPNGQIEYKNEVNYKNLHAVIAFINNYNLKNSPIKEGPSKIDKVKETISKQVPHTDSKPAVKTRKRVPKKRQEVEGQLSFTDLI